MNGIPEKIGRYEVERLLGQGAMGSVFLGRDPQLDRAVAIKTVRDLDLEEGRMTIFLERFRNEAKAAARLAHPAIVAVYDVGEDPQLGPYLVFEYIAGSTLKQILRGRGPLDPEDAVRLARQVGAALDVAHAAGVVHRDIKPDNILVAASGDAKLADFGIARLPDAALTKEGQFLGTPCYAAPETLERGKYGAHSDLFSFAAVLYEIVSGTRAFPGDDAIAVAHAVVHDEPISVAKAAEVVGVKVPRGVEKVITRGLSKDLTARYASAAEMVDALSAAYIDAGVLDRDPTGVQVLPPPEPATAGGSSGVFVAVIAGLAILGIGFVVAFVDLGQDPGPGPAALDAGAADGGVDAGLDLVVPDAGEPLDAFTPAPTHDGGGAAPDANLPAVDGMSAFEREEAAKDEVDLARAALASSDLAAARAALARARAFDPGNSDLVELAAQIEAAAAAP